MNSLYHLLLHNMIFELLLSHISCQRLKAQLLLLEVL